MGRKNKYDTHIKPNLEQIKEWIATQTEKQICERLGVAVSTFEVYKAEHKELKEALLQGKQDLVSELKSALKKKAKGFEYEEQKTIIRQHDGKRTEVVEKYKKYAVPDTVAIHLLLKNLDKDWTNDDKTTIELKKRQMDINEKKVEEDNW